MSDDNQEQEQKQEEINFLDLPDGELGEMPEDFLTDLPEEQSSEIENSSEVIDGDDDDDKDDKKEEGEGEGEKEGKQESQSSDSDSELENQEEEDENEEESGKPKNYFEEGSKGSSDGTAKESSKAKKKDDNTDDSDKNTDDSITAEDQLKQLFAPFKANGRDMQVSSIGDAITLMSMGANYNKKMQGLKPNLRLMKMLENNKLLDEQKLSFLIDLQNQNPAAIAKLVKDSGFDPIDHDEDNTDYTPGTYTVNETEVDLDMVLEEIKDTPSFQNTIDIISKKWDAASRKLVQEDPNIIRVINDHVDNGMYDQIMGIVQNEKALNRLTEMSDLQAYKHVGDTLQAQGAFAPQPDANASTPAKKKPQDPKLNSRKKAAANTRSKPAKKQGAIDPLNLSDEDFAKLDPALM